MKSFDRRTGLKCIAFANVPLLFVQPTAATAGQVTLTSNFHCEVGIDTWRSSWSPEKKNWCCIQEGVACLYDCNFERDQLDIAWASQKKDWCCKSKNIGCSPVLDQGEHAEEVGGQVADVQGAAPSVSDDGQYVDGPLLESHGYIFVGYGTRSFADDACKQYHGLPAPKTEAEFLALLAAVNDAKAAGHLLPDWPYNTFWLAGHYSEARQAWIWPDGTNVHHHKNHHDHPLETGNDNTGKVEKWMCQLLDGAWNDSPGFYKFGIFCDLGRQAKHSAIIVQAPTAERTHTKAVSIEPEDSMSWRWIEFQVKKIRDDHTDVTQIAELWFLWRGAPASMVGAIASVSGGGSAVSHPPQNSIDGDVSTKWVAAVLQSALRIEFPQPANLDAFGFTTGDDSSARDPVQWVLRGSNDGENWHELHRQDQDYTTPLVRGAATNDFPMTVTHAAEGVEVDETSANGLGLTSWLIILLAIGICLLLAGLGVLLYLRNHRKNVSGTRGFKVENINDTSDDDTHSEDESARTLTRRGDGDETHRFSSLGGYRLTPSYLLQWFLDQNQRNFERRSGIVQEAPVVRGVVAPTSVVYTGVNPSFSIPRQDSHVTVAPLISPACTNTVHVGTYPRYA